MSYQQWKLWIKQMPWVLKWFVLLVLIRPLVDNFYYLKEVSPFLSPLYIVGVLTPILCIYSIAKLPKSCHSNLDGYFRIWSFFLLIGIGGIFLFDPGSLKSLEFLIKLSLPIYLYFFLRKLIRSQKDLDGILQTFLYSGILVAGLLLYEVLINPIRVVESRGLSRIQGNFADVMNYGIYIVFSFLIICYFYFSRKKELKQNKRFVQVGLVGVLCAVGLINISHTATWFVFGVLLLLFALYNVKMNKGGAFVVIIVLGSIFAVVGNQTIDERIKPLIEKDIAVYEGQTSSDRLLHGRMGRWRMMWEDFSNLPVHVQFFGYPFMFEYAYQYVGVGSHNDYLRQLFLMGYVGLFFYLLLLARLFSRSRGLSPPQEFLALGAIAILMMYSVTTTPTFYAPFMYIVLSVAAFVALPTYTKVSVGKPN